MELFKNAYAKSTIKFGSAYIAVQCDIGFKASTPTEKMSTHSLYSNSVS